MLAMSMLFSYIPLVFWVVLDCKTPSRKAKSITPSIWRDQ